MFQLHINWFSREESRWSGELMIWHQPKGMLGSPIWGNLMTTVSQNLFAVQSFWETKKWWMIWRFATFWKKGSVYHTHLPWKVHPLWNSKGSVKNALSLQKVSQTAVSDVWGPETLKPSNPLMGPKTLFDYYFLGGRGSGGGVQVFVINWWFGLQIYSCCSRKFFQKLRVWEWVQEIMTSNFWFLFFFHPIS